MEALSLLLSHTLFLYLVLLEPPIGVRAHRRLLRATNYEPGARIRCYQRLIAASVLSALLVAVILVAGGLPARVVGLNAPQTRLIDWSAVIGDRWRLAAVSAAVLLFALSWWLQPADRRRVSPRAPNEAVTALLPTTRRERWAFAGLGLTAAVCEELLYRGFLLHYLQAVFPEMAVAFAVVLSAAVFGLAHLSQGLAGAAGATAAGAVLALAYIGTGSLVLPIALHALANLRFVLCRRGPKREPVEPAPA